MRLAMSYHSCMLKNAEVTNKIISATKICIAPTNKCMWKCPNGVPNGVKTRSKANNERTMAIKQLTSILLLNSSCIDGSWEKKTVFLYSKTVNLLIYNY